MDLATYDNPRTAGLSIYNHEHVLGPMGPSLSEVGDGRGHGTTEIDSDSKEQCLYSELLCF